MSDTPDTVTLTLTREEAEAVHTDSVNSLRFWEGKASAHWEAMWARIADKIANALDNPQPSHEEGPK